MKCNFRLVLEGKIGKEIPEPSRLEFLEQFSANNFALSYAEDNTSCPLNREGIADLSLLRTLLAFHQKSQRRGFWEKMDFFVLVAYASLVASRTLLQQLLAYLYYTLNSEDLFCRYKRRRWFLWAMAASQAAKNHGDEWGIYAWIPTWTHSQISLAVAETFSLKISSHGTSLKWSQRPYQVVWE